jgi:hypothetical protein
MDFTQSANFGKSIFQNLKISGVKPSYGAKATADCLISGIDIPVSDLAQTKK